jgi:hypothetical protein
MPNNTRKVPNFLKKAYKAVQKNLGYGNMTENNLKKIKEQKNAEWAAEQAANQAAKAAKAANLAVKEVNAVVQNVKKCNTKNAPKPKFNIKTGKMTPAYKNWKEACAAPAAGGARHKTRRGKKSRRMTRRR